MSQRALIMDLDGTLCVVSGLLHLSHNAFHVAATTVAPPDPTMRAICRAAVAEDVSVLVVTGRSDRWRSDTTTWLRRHLIPFDGAYFRKEGDYRSNADAKRDLLDDIWNDGYRPTVAYDDQPTVCDMWRSAGLDVVQVPGWDARLT